MYDINMVAINMTVGAIKEAGVAVFVIDGDNNLLSKYMCDVIIHTQFPFII